MTALSELILVGAENHPDAPALLAPGQASSSYAALASQVQDGARFLRGAGVAAADVVALSLPNSAGTATAFLAAATAGICAPLNPGYTESEAAFYIDDLTPTAVVVRADTPSPAADVALARGIACFGLVEHGPAGELRFECLAEGRRKPVGGTGRADDVALILHTSGTTSRPKQVPLTHANLLRSAANVAAALELSPSDRCLSVMPLFHIHGLVAALLASLHAGASVVCPPPFDPGAFFDWVEETEPTWYTAVPTIHHAVLAAARTRPGSPARARLRFIRSSSAAMPPRLLADLETELGVPVIEAYGMTEAAHQIASNRLPPGVRKPGTVGVAAGPEVTVLDEDGMQLPVGSTGELALRGANVTSGYVANPEATAAAFTEDGWFRTGDEGVIDEDGYITITGRLKELINRGGEKIAPRDVEEALLEHDGVGQAVAFAVDHPTLGEDVGAAVVPAPGATIDTDALRRFASERLAPFKVPRRILVLDAIPLGATGKIQRVGLGERLGFAQRANAGPDPDGLVEDGLEGDLAALWREILGIDGQLTRDDDFFDLGGNSLLAVQLVVEIEQRFGAQVGLAELAQITTLGGLADRVRRGSGVPVEGARAAVLLRPGDPTLTPLFLVPGRGGTALSMYRLATTIDSEHPIYALEAVGVRAGETPLGTIEAMAAHQLVSLRAVQAKGPYQLGGYSVGGLIAYEMARGLASEGEQLGLLAMIDTACPGPRLTAARRAWKARAVRQVGRVRAAAQRAARREGPAADPEGDLAASGRRRLRPVIRAQRAAAWRYRPGAYGGGMAVLYTESKRASMRSPDLGWSELVAGPITTHPIPGTHVTAAREPHVAVLGRRFTDLLVAEAHVDSAAKDEWR